MWKILQMRVFIWRRLLATLPWNFSKCQFHYIRIWVLLGLHKMSRPYTRKTTRCQSQGRSTVLNDTFVNKEFRFLGSWLPRFDSWCDVVDPSTIVDCRAKCRISWILTGLLNFRLRWLFFCFIFVRSFGLLYKLRSEGVRGLRRKTRLKMIRQKKIQKQVLITNINWGPYSNLPRLKRSKCFEISSFT